MMNNTETCYEVAQQALNSSCHNVFLTDMLINLTDVYADHLANQLASQEHYNGMILLSNSENAWNILFRVKEKYEQHGYDSYSSVLPSNLYYILEISNGNNIITIPNDVNAINAIKGKTPSELIVDDFSQASIDVLECILPLMASVPLKAVFVSDTVSQLGAPTLFDKCWHKTSDAMSLLSHRDAWHEDLTRYPLTHKYSDNSGDTNNTSPIALS